MSAARNGRLRVVQKIKAGAKPDLRDETGWTALMFAVRNGRLGVVKEFFFDFNTFASKSVKIKKLKLVLTLIFKTKMGRQYMI